jgi:O-methyltransferase
MQTKPETLYLDLMKKTLMFLLWPQPPIPVTQFNFHRPPVKRFLFSTVSKLFDKTNYRVMQKWEYTAEARENGTAWIPYSHTHIGLKRLNNLQECIETVLKDGVEGDLIETGVWRGGATIFMKAVLTAHGDETRKVFVADSFEGLPKPDAERYPADEGDNFFEHPYAVSQEDVAENFRSFGLLDDRVVFIKGWFEDTLPTAPVEKLSVLRLDGDMYGSTITALENLYPKLSPGGFCIIDDYNLGPCRQAVHDYLEKNNIQADIRDIDGSGAFWRKNR